MATCKPRSLANGNVVFDVRYRLAGGAPRCKTFDRERDGKAFKATVESDKYRGTMFDPRLGRVTLRAYAEEWLATRPKLRPRTRETYEGQLRLHILPTLGAIQIGKLSPTQVRSWHAKLSEKLGPNTVAKCYRLLRTILTTAVDDERLARNPCKVKGAGVEYTPERPIATPEQVWNLAELMPRRFRCMVLLAGFGNPRLSELLGLERRHVNPLQRKISTLQGEHQLSNGELILTEPKSAKSRRTFVLPASLMDELNEHMAEFTGAEPTARVFTGEKGGPLRRHVFYKHWNRAREQVDLPDGFDFHDLRHTAQTLAAQAGATLADLQHRGGHSTVQAVMIYQHATDESDAQVADGMNEMMSEAKAGRAMNAPQVPVADAAEEHEASDIAQLPASSDQSGRRESNPRSQLGKLMFCR